MAASAVVQGANDSAEWEQELLVATLEAPLLVESGTYLYIGYEFVEGTDRDTDPRPVQCAAGCDLTQQAYSYMVEGNRWDGDVGWADFSNAPDLRASISR